MRFVLFELPRTEGPTTDHRVLQHVSDARARPELSYLFRSFRLRRSACADDFHHAAFAPCGIWPEESARECSRCPLFWKEPRLLRRLLRSPSRGLLVAFFSRLLGEKAMTSSNCSSPPRMTTEFDLPRLLRARVASIRSNSVGRNLQVKGLRICIVPLPTFDGPPFLGKTKRDGSPPSKASSTLCHRRGSTKSLESLA